MNEELERQIIEVVATDRIGIPIKSVSGKLDRAKPKLAKGVDLSEYDDDFQGERVYARIEENGVMKARGMRNAIDLFSREYPRHGKILSGLIAEQRQLSETHFYFGMQEGCRLTADDYLSVMTNLGFTENTAKRLYPELMDISHKMRRKRQEERSILIG